MVDFIVCHIRDSDLAASLLENKMLDFGLKVSERTGNIFNNGRKDGKFLNIEIMIWSNGFIKISGSLHTFYNALRGITNNGGQPMNHDTFDLAKLKYVIEYLNLHLGINPVNVAIHQIEFGVNLNLGIPTKALIDSFIAYNKYPFERMHNIKAMGYGRESCLKQYRIKIYDKALQNSLHNNIFRFEYKAQKMQPVFGKQEIYLIDLLDTSRWHDLGTMLIEALDDCIIVDEINPLDLKATQLKLIEECKNPRNWESFNTKRRAYCKKQFNSIMELHGRLKIKQKIRDGIRCELMKMLSEIE